MLVTPALRTYFALDMPPLHVLLAEFGIAGLAAVALEIGLAGGPTRGGPGGLATVAARDLHGGILMTDRGAVRRLTSRPGQPSTGGPSRSPVDAAS